MTDNCALVVFFGYVVVFCSDISLKRMRTLPLDLGKPRRPLINMRTGAGYMEDEATWQVLNSCPEWDWQICRWQRLRLQQGATRASRPARSAHTIAWRGNEGEPTGVFASLKLGCGLLN